MPNKTLNTIIESGLSTRGVIKVNNKTKVEALPKIIVNTLKLIGKKRQPDYLNQDSYQMKAWRS